MKHGIMRFMGYTLHHNPHTLEVTNASNVIQHIIPNSVAITQSIGNNPIVIKGDGAFYGENAFEQYMRLKDIGEKCRVGVLSVSGVNPFYAYLSQMKLKCTPVDDYVEYSFMFVEAPNYQEKENSTAPTEYTVKSNQSLWDIAHSIGVSSDTLLALNPQLKDTNDVSEGDVIKINDI
jgi:hypothetical protein